MEEMSKLPLSRDNYKNIMMRMDSRTLLNFCSTHKYGKEICSDEKFWIQRFRYEFQYDPSKYQKSPNRTWRDFFLQIVYYNNLSQNNANKAAEFAAFDGKIDIVDYYISQNDYKKLEKADIPAFIAPIVIDKYLINFILNTDFGTVNTPKGKQNISDILAPLLKIGIISRSVLFALFNIYAKDNSLNNQGIIKADKHLNEYLGNYLDIIESKENFDRKSFTSNRVLSIFKYGIIPEDQLSENQIEYIRNEGIARKIREVQRLLIKRLNN